MSAYTAPGAFIHGQSTKIGVLICNLGTPAAPTPTAVRKYLAEFLSDKRVVELSDWLWKPILHGVILRIRPSRSAAAYQQVWSANGSPLLDISKQQVAAIQSALEQTHPETFTAALAMRYGEPSISAGLQSLRDAQVRKIIILPLYPQYAAATTGSVFDAVSKEISQWRWVPEIHFVNEYHSDTRYLDALASSLEDYWQAHGKGERLLMSFHGIPEEYFLAGDPYFCHCQATAREVANRLELTDKDWQISFQSRVGRKRWLQPYTDKMVATLAKDGVKRLDIICPGFAADCLETLEEIAMQNAEIFHEHGGDDLHYVPALNADTAHINFLRDFIVEHCQTWVDQQTRNELSSEQARQATKTRARELGAAQFPGADIGT
ncbi:MAG: ferrochelatase [Pseudomonadota bacterium]